MSSITTLPDWKPTIGMAMFSSSRLHPKKLPYFEKDRVWISSGTSDGDFSNPSKKSAWQEGHLFTSPSSWWMTYFILGNHPNYDKIPDDLIILKEMYHASMQLRLALGYKVESFFKQHALAEWRAYSESLKTMTN